MVCYNNKKLFWEVFKMKSSKKVVTRVLVAALALSMVAGTGIGAAAVDTVDTDYEIVDARLAEYGLHLSGKTKCINHNRGKEIADYIKISSHNCYMFLILDDESFDIKSYFPHQLIQTDFKTGFNRKCLNKAKEYIRRKLLWSLKNQEL